MSKINLILKHLVSTRLLTTNTGKTSIFLPIHKRTFTLNSIKMVQATWEGVVIAESDACVEVEGNQYFPATALKMEHFKPADNTTVCGWKGTANYYDIEVNGKVNKGAAWYYANPKPAADKIKGMIAFWKGVQVKK